MARKGCSIDMTSVRGASSREEAAGSFPFVSIIVLNFNGMKYLDGCIQSLGNLDYPSSKYHVLLVDNHSSDGSIEHVYKNHPWVDIVQTDRNLGYTGGNNFGSRVANGEYL